MGKQQGGVAGRYWPGLHPVSARKLRTKWLWSKKPSCWARHAIGSCAPGSNWQARWMRRRRIAQRAGAGAATEQAHQMEAADAAAAASSVTAAAATGAHRHSAGLAAVRRPAAGKRDGGRIGRTDGGHAGRREGWPMVRGRRAISPSVEAGAYPNGEADGRAGGARTNARPANRPRPHHQQRRRQHHQRPRRLLREHARDRHHRRQGSTPQRASMAAPAGTQPARPACTRAAPPGHSRSHSRADRGSGTCRRDSRRRRPLPTRSGHPGLPPPARMRAMRGRFPFLRRLPALLTCLLLLTALPPGARTARVQRIGARPDHQQRRRQHHQRPSAAARTCPRPPSSPPGVNTPARAWPPPAGTAASRRARRACTTPKPGDSRSHSRPMPGPRSGNITNRRCMDALRESCRRDSRRRRRCLPFGSPGCPTPARMRAMRGRPFLVLCACRRCDVPAVDRPARPAVQRPPVSGGLPDYEHTGRRHLGHHPGPGRPVVAGHRPRPVPLRWPPFRTAAGPGRQPLPVHQHGHPGPWP